MTLLPRSLKAAGRRGDAAASRATEIDLAFLSASVKLAQGRADDARPFLELADTAIRRLCVLSTCDTGLSDPGLLADSFVGLAGAFLEAGAAEVIGTMWPVPNAGAAAMSAAIHEHIGRDGLSPSSAIREAASALRARHASA